MTLCQWNSFFRHCDTAIYNKTKIGIIMLKYLNLMALLIGCFSTSLFSSPQWFNDIHQEAGFIIGVGVGESIADAKQSAMTDIGNTLYSNVSSVIKNKVIVHNEEVDTEFLSTKLVSSENVLLPKVSWGNLQSDDEVYYAMAKVKVSEIIALYEKNLDLQLNQFDNLLDKNKLSLNEYLQLRASEKKLKLAAQRAAAISNLSKKAEINFYEIMSLFNKQNKFIGSVCFDVKESRERLADKIYLPAIESAVQADNFELKKRASCIPIKFWSKTEKTGKTIANVTMQLTIGSPSITTNVIKFKGRSNGSYKAAMFDAADQFGNYFERTGGLLNALLQESDKTIVID
jgi:hypothetical protein